MQQQSTNLYEKIAQQILASKAIIYTAGAGMGVDSGLPDFRGAQGFWTNYKPFRNKFKFQECANPRFLHEHPRLFWGFYGHRLELYRKTDPHKGFTILKQITMLPNIKSHFILTSNVDGHFQKAAYQVVYNQDTFEATDPLPICQECNKQTVRPNILMFNDYTFLEDRIYDQQLEYENFIENLKMNRNNPITIIEFGAGMNIQTTRYYGEQLFNQYFRNIMFVRVNPRDSQAPNENWEINNQGQVLEGKQFIALKEGALSAIENIWQQVQLLTQNETHHK